MGTPASPAITRLGWRAAFSTEGFARLLQRAAKAARVSALGESAIWKLERRGEIE
jgi:hypothetical protein